MRILCSNHLQEIWQRATNTQTGCRKCIPLTTRPSLNTRTAELTKGCLTLPWLLNGITSYHLELLWVVKHCHMITSGMVLKNIIGQSGELCHIVLSSISIIKEQLPAFSFKYVTTFETLSNEQQADKHKHLIISANIRTNIFGIIKCYIRLRMSPINVNQIFFVKHSFNFSHIA